MRHDPFPSLDELLAPVTLTRLCHEPIHTVSTSPFGKGHSASGSHFLAVETNGGQGPRFVVKLSSLAWDWIMRGTDDQLGRETLVWTTGLLDRLPPEIAHPVIGCAREDDGWAIVMHDVSEAMLADPFSESPISQSDHRRYLDALAALHATFWEEPLAADLARGFCSPWHLYTVFSPATGQREMDHPNEVVREIREGWELLWSLVEPDVAALLRRLLEDPTALCTALARYPQTVVHGDPRPSNLGTVHGPNPRVVLIDWQLVGRGVPGVDLSWYLANLGHKAPVAHETTIAWYREALAHRLGARFDESWWQPQLALSLLGLLVRLGWSYGWDARFFSNAVVREWIRKDLSWWCERAREGARWLS